MCKNQDAFFLDTSTQINKTWEDESVRKYLNNELSQKECYSSVYVRNQYKYRIIKDTVIAYNIIVQANTLEEAKERLEELHTQKIIKELPLKVFKRYFQDLNSKKRVLKRIELLIESKWKDYFFGNIKQHLFDLTKCKYANGEAYKSKNFYIDINDKCPEDCNVCDFLDTRQKDLKVFADIGEDVLDNAIDPKGTLKKAQEVSLSILNGDSPHGKHCKAISDAIIAIEARDSCPGITIHSMDNDFDLLGSVLGIDTKVQTIHFIKKQVDSKGTLSTD